MRRADVRKTDSSRLGRAKLNVKGGARSEAVAKPEPVAAPKVKVSRKEK